jgi:hypothetical protein
MSDTKMSKEQLGTCDASKVHYGSTQPHPHQASCINWKRLPDAKQGEPRKFPIGGDPTKFCVCGHHEMNHANYADLPRSCNQTGCECRDYQRERTVLTNLAGGRGATG